MSSCASAGSSISQARGTMRIVGFGVERPRRSPARPPASCKPPRWPGSSPPSQCGGDSLAGFLPLPNDCAERNPARILALVDARPAEPEWARLCCSICIIVWNRVILCLVPVEARGIMTSAPASAPRSTSRWTTSAGMFRFRPPSSPVKRICRSVAVAGELRLCRLSRQFRAALRICPKKSPTFLPR